MSEKYAKRAGHKRAHSKTINKQEQKRQMKSRGKLNMYERKHKENGRRGK